MAVENLNMRTRVAAIRMNSINQDTVQVVTLKTYSMCHILQNCLQPSRFPSSAKATAFPFNRILIHGNKKILCKMKTPLSNLMNEDKCCRI